jgi:hypothetical protein
MLWDFARDSRADLRQPGRDGSGASPHELPRLLRPLWHEEIDWDVSQRDRSALARAEVARLTPRLVRSARDAALKARAPTAMPLSNVRRRFGPTHAGDFDLVTSGDRTNGT